MFVATTGDLNHIFTGADIQPQISEDYHTASELDLRCPICGKPLTCNSHSTEEPLKYFVHGDGSSDCFTSDSVSDEHRLAAEVTVKCLHNRICEVTGEPVEINVERWIGSSSQFIITDVIVTSPLQVAAEIYYRPGNLGLGRRLKTMFNNDYRTYLVFHTNGEYNINKIEQHLQKIAPLRVGRFNPESLDLTLGDLFTRHRIDLNHSKRDQLPNYIML